MTRAQEIRDHVAANPGATSQQIATAIGWDITRVAASLLGDINKRKPSLRRELHHVSITNSPVYAYYPWSGSVNRTALTTEKPAPLVEKPVLPRKSKAQVPQKAGSLDQLADTLARSVADTVTALVHKHLEVALSGLISTVPAISASQLREQVNGTLANLVAHKPTVLVAGLLPSQAGLIQREFGEVFDLRFFTTDGNLRHLRNMVKGVDHVFTFTSKVSHAVEEVMTSEGHKVHRCSGGMTMLKDQLLALYAEGT